MPVTPGPIEGSLQGCKDSISGALAATLLQFRISAVSPEPLRSAELGPHAGWRSRDPIEPFPDLLRRQVVEFGMPQLRLDDRIDGRAGLLG